MTKGKRGERNPKHIVTDETRRYVKTMSGLGFTVDDIGIVMDIAGRTVQRLYTVELRKGKIEAVAQVAQRLFKLAMSDSPKAFQAMQFYLRTQGQWKEHSVVEHVSGEELKLMDATAELRRLVQRQQKAITDGSKDDELVFEESDDDDGQDDVEIVKVVDMPEGDGESE